MKGRWFSTISSKFDARFISKDTGYKWPWHRTHDTMTMAHLDDPLRPKGLKPLSAKLVDPQAASAQKLLSQGMSDNHWTWETVPIDYTYYWIYAAMDPVLTCHIYEKLAPAVFSQYKEAYDIELGATRVIAQMEAKGARINPAYCRDKATSLRQYAQDARTWLHDVHGIDKPTPAKLTAYFLEHDHQLTKKTKSGNSLAMDKDVLDKLVLSGDPVAATVLNIRKAEKTVTTYLDNLISSADEHDRVHPNIWVAGARTSRMSITDPALQTLPRTDPTVRTAFIPSEGNVLISCDADQIEARLMAHFSQDPGLIAAFHSEEDFFCQIASGIFGEKIVKGDPRRQLTKNTIYGKLYGAGALKMAETAGIDESIMVSVVRKFDTSFPGVKAMQKAIDKVANQRLHDTGVAYINTPTGRRLAADDGKGYTLTNYLIQSHAAEILKRGICNLDAALPGEYMILPVHDEVVFDVPADEVDDVKRLIEETLTDMDTYAVPITWSADVMTTDWGQKYR